MQIYFIFVVLAGLLAPAFAADTSASLPYPLQEVQYTGFLGGHQVQLNGTVQEIYAQMKVLHPEFDPDHPGVASETETLTSRGALAKDGYLCCTEIAQNWNYANADPIDDGIRYLKGLGPISINARSCGRISCSYASGIYLCNDNYYTIAPAAPYLATYASDLIQKCSQFPPLGQQIVCGQEFDSDNYNVIVHSDRC